MQISWLGHACFLIESEGYQVVVDPFNDVPGCKDTVAEVDAVLCSHDHHDHNHCAGVTLRQGKESPFTVSVVDTFHDEKGGTLRGKNKVHVLQAEGLKAVHLGDLGHRLQERQAEVLRGCDVLMIPVGGFYTIDAAAAAGTVAQLQPRVVIPMHYRGAGFGFDVIDTVEPFLSCFPEKLVRHLESSTLEVTAATPHQITVLAFPV